MTSSPRLKPGGFPISRHGSLSDRLIQATGLPQLGQKFVVSSSFCPQLGQ